MRRDHGTGLAMLVKYSLFRKRDKRNMMLEKISQFLVNVLQHRNVGIPLQNIQGFLYLLQVRFEKVDMPVFKKVLSLRVYRRNDAGFLANGNDHLDNGLCQNALIIIFEDHHIGSFPSYEYFKKVDQPL